jgi:3-oxoadipate enol-lactonase
MVIAIGRFSVVMAVDIRRRQAFGKAFSKGRLRAIATARAGFKGKIMPVIDADGCPIHVEVDGFDGAPVLILSNSLGTTLHMWEPQVAPFTKQFRVVRFDRRGHGRSGLPKGPYTMERLGRDALAVMDGLGIEKANWCGLSMGGMEGMWLGASAPERFDKIILSNTSCYYPNKELWNERISTIRARGGLAPVADRLMGLWFTKEFREREPAIVERLKEGLAATPMEGYIACGEAVRDMDHREILSQIKAPTLVIIGRHDQATTPEAGAFIRSRISGAAVAVLDAAHISNVEQPTQFTDIVQSFLVRPR